MSGYTSVSSTSWARQNVHPERPIEDDYNALFASQRLKGKLGPGGRCQHESGRRVSDVGSGDPLGIFRLDGGRRGLGGSIDRRCGSGILDLGWREGGGRLVRGGVRCRPVQPCE